MQISSIELLLYCQRLLILQNIWNFANGQIGTSEGTYIRQTDFFYFALQAIFFISFMQISSIELLLYCQRLLILQNIWNFANGQIGTSEGTYIRQTDFFYFALQAIFFISFMQILSIELFLYCYSIFHRKMQM